MTSSDITYGTEGEPISVTLYLPFKAVVKARPRLGRRRKAFTPQKTVDFEMKVREWWSANGHHFGDKPVFVGLEIHQDGMLVTVTELEQSVRPIGVLGDVDNFCKAILDGLQPHKNHPTGGNGAFMNDRQVEWLEVKLVGVPRKPKKPKMVKANVVPVPEGKQTWSYDD